MPPSVPEASQPLLAGGLQQGAPGAGRQGTGRCVAVVGAGVAGIVAAHELAKAHDVILIEAEARLGGHTYTVDVDKTTSVDMGFIVCNERNYPLFYAFLDELGVPRAPTAMSFSYHDPAMGFCYAGSKPNQLFAQRKNLFNPTHWRMLRDILRFGQAAEDGHASQSFGKQTLGEWLRDHGLTGPVRERYILPMAAAIWSAPYGEVEAFPMQAFAQFYHNHGLLSLRNRPRWAFIPGGSQRYVRAFREQFHGVVYAGSPVRAIRRLPDGVMVLLEDGEIACDAVVLACHADQALALLEDPSEEERNCLTPWTYSHNEAILHTDTSVLPTERRAWACWNYRNEPARAANAPVSVHYHMNQLQQLGGETQYIVSLNPTTPIPSHHIIHTKTFMHPQYTFSSMETQSRLAALQGVHRTYYCGSYHGYGFHEDAVRSAHAMCSAMASVAPSAEEGPR